MSKVYFWIDTETTGLESNATVLEVAVLATNKDYEEIAFPFVSLVRPTTRYLGRAETALIPYMNDFVRKMHLTNGLLYELLDNYDSIPDRRGVDDELYEWALEITKAASCEEKPVLAGSTVHFDRAKVESSFKQFNSLLHYRNLDVSSWKEVIKDQFPEIASKWNAQVGDVKPHRALEDIRTSVSELRFYLDSIRKL